jgi:hypothetical protein
VPLLLGRWRFFLRLTALSVLAYAASGGITLLAMGPAYGWQQYGGYARLLLNLRAQFPWRGPEAPFLGYNHSVTQVVVFLLGVSPATLRMATLVKALLLLPLALVAARLLRRPSGQPGHQVPALALDLAFTLYLGTFIWLDMVWEATLAGAAFAYLLPKLSARSARALGWAVFVPYTLVDLWQVVSFALFGSRVLAPGPYVLTDPSIYIPLVLAVIIAFYGLLVWRLWKTTPGRSRIEPRHSEVGIC